MSDLSDKILRRQAGNSAKKQRAPKDPKRMSTGRVLKYALLPDFGSRIREIGKRLGGFAYFLAQIFHSCRLIPAGHPTLQPANIGYFGFSDVIATAASNLQMRRENIDQIVMFGAVVVSMVLLVANGLAIAAYTVLDFGSAFAQEAAPVAAEAASGSMFVAPHPETDLALQFLDRVFGTTSVPFFASTPGAYDSALGGNAIKDALYAMLGVYSSAMMVIAMIIVIYYAFTVVGESAMTGQPFGKRFNSFWAPIRLVVGLGLLVPIGGGLNSAQYITLYAAKLGSGMASYAWTGFVDKLASTNLIAAPETIPVTGLVADVIRFESCRAVANRVGWFTGSEVVKLTIKSGDKTYGTLYSWAKDPQSAMRTEAAVGGAASGAGFGVAGAGLGAGIAMATTNTSAATIAPKDLPKWLKRSACGSIIVNNRVAAVTTENNPRSITQDMDTTQLYTANVGMMDAIIAAVRPTVENYAKDSSLLDADPGEELTSDQTKAMEDLMATVVGTTMVTSNEAIANFYKVYDEQFRGKISDRVGKLDQYGWMGAGMFYNQLADLNGGLAKAIQNTFPQVKSNMQVISEAADSSGSSGQKPEGAYNENISREILNAVGKIDSIITTSSTPEMEANDGRAIRDGMGGNIVAFVARHLFGGKYLEDFRRADQTNPMVNMINMGHGFFTKGVDFIGWILALLALGPVLGGVASVVGTVAGGMLAATGVGAPAGLALAAGGIAIGILASLAKAAAGFLIFVAFVGVAIGATLYYIVPLMPFVFFFFAVIAWILEVVEAMVGLPLWALAHIRIDGDGLSGQAAQTGYNIIFGIIIRPVVILFALIVGIILFSAAMMMLNQMFSFYVGSISDGENTGIDYMMFSAVYALIAYTLATLCFKQCDQMPNQILRWFGVSDARYNDGQPDPTETIRQASAAAGFVATQLGQQGSQMANSISSGVEGGVSNVKGARDKKLGENQAAAADAKRDRQHEDMMGAIGGGGTP